MRDAYDIGRTVLKALDRGHQLARKYWREKAAESHAAVARLAAEDALRFGPRGRAGRIAKKLHGLRSERQVRRILDALSKASESL